MKVSVGYSATVEFTNKCGHRCVVPIWRIGSEWECADRCMEYWPDTRGVRGGEDMCIWTYLPVGFKIPRKWILTAEHKLQSRKAT
jgi:hypothetical protein